MGNSISPTLPGKAIKIYAALLTQAGTAAPTAVVLQNDLDEDLVWSYIQTGQYKLTSPNDAFVAEKTIVFMNNCKVNGGAPYLFNGYRVDTNEVWVESFFVIDEDFQNNRLNNTYIEIRVYA